MRIHEQSRDQGMQGNLKNYCRSTKKWKKKNSMYHLKFLQYLSLKKKNFFQKCSIRVENFCDLKTVKMNYILVVFWYQGRSKSLIFMKWLLPLLFVNEINDYAIWSEGIFLENSDIESKWTLSNCLSNAITYVITVKTLKGS